MGGEEAGSVGDWADEAAVRGTVEAEGPVAEIAPIPGPDDASRKHDAQDRGHRSSGALVHGGIRGAAVESRLCPLVVRTRLMTGPYAGLPLVTKGGSAGAPDLLAAIVRQLGRGVR